MLIDILCKDAIQLGINASDWKEAVEKAAYPLFIANKIEKRYIASIIKSAEINGPYFVLLPNVALTHARPEDGVIENGIGITVLKKGVEFGNQANDPVKYIFTLGAKSNRSHLDALTQLASLFEDKKFFEVLDYSESANEIIKYIEEVSLDV